MPQISFSEVFDILLIGVRENVTQGSKTSESRLNELNKFFVSIIPIDRIMKTERRRFAEGAKSDLSAASLEATNAQNNLT